MDTPPPPRAVRSAPATRLYLAIAAGNKQYAIDLDRVQGIHGSYVIDTAPGGPPYLAGTITMHHKLAPVIDLRLKFQLGPPAVRRSPAVITLRTTGGAMGLLVDHISDIRPLAIARAAPGNRRGDAAFVAGMGSGDGHAVPLACVDRILSLHEWRALEHVLQRRFGAVPMPKQRLGQIDEVLVDGFPFSA